MQISRDRLGHTVTVSDSPILYVCRGKSPRGVRAKPSLSRDLDSMIEKIAQTPLYVFVEPSPSEVIR